LFPQTPRPPSQVSEDLLYDPKVLNRRQTAPRLPNASPRSGTTARRHPRRLRLACKSASVILCRRNVRGKELHATRTRLLKISYKAMLYKIRQLGLDNRHERGV